MPSCRFLFRVGSNTVCSRKLWCYASMANMFWTLWWDGLKTRMGTFSTICPCLPYYCRQSKIPIFGSKYNNKQVLVTFWQHNWTCHHFVDSFQCILPQVTWLLPHQLWEWFWWNCHLAWFSRFGFGWILMTCHYNKSRIWKSLTILICSKSLMAHFTWLHKFIWSSEWFRPHCKACSCYCHTFLSKSRYNRRFWLCDGWLLVQMGSIQA